MPILAYNLIALGLASGVAGDGWDDFTNNLATDLAPIISLFGEEATKQYLSESLHWIDYFIFAMAPIGILTALVSAIRVCGSSSLKAFIGRAREGTGNVEAELLSSTSHNVCELYNSGGITRIFGRPKILEFVHNPNAQDSEFIDPRGTAGISTFQNYVEKPEGKKEWKSSPKRGLKFSHEEYAPNLSHNVGIKRLDYVWFVLAAILGIVLQAGVLIFAGIATYLLRLEKEGAQPPSYACPMVLGDQTFESFCYVDNGRNGSLSRYVSSWKKQHETSSWYVWAAVAITISGFVLQFVGLRGTHSAISMAQLGAALVMSVARAALRTQRLDTKDNMFKKTKTILDGHELDWLAFRMGENELSESLQSHSSKAAPISSVDADPPEPISWSYHGLADPGRRIKCERRISSRTDSRDKMSAERLLAYRRVLAQLTKSKFGGRILSRNFANEMVFVRDMSEKLVLSIESVANVFFGTATIMASCRSAGVLSWGFKCGLSLNGENKNIEELIIHLNRLSNGFGVREGLWKLENRHNLEAILGLWLWSLTCNHEPATRQHVNPGALTRRDRVPTLKRRIISMDMDPKDLGLDTWLGSSRPPTLKKKVMATSHECNPSIILCHTTNDLEHFIPLPSNEACFPGPVSGTSYCQLFGWYAGEGYISSSSPTDIRTPHQTWTIPTTSDTLSLCAQEVLGVFVKSILDTTADIGRVQPDPTNRHLKSTLLSDVIDAIVTSGVASRDDAVWCILPQVISKERSAQRTPLWHAASIGCVGLVESLLRETDVNLELGDSHGRTALWQAAANGHDDVVLILLNHGADAGAMDRDGTTAFAKAAENGNRLVVKVLLDQTDADPDLKNASGKTALHLAAANGHADVVQTLLDEGADDKITDAYETTPLSMAIDSGHATTIKLLNAHRAEIISHHTNESMQEPGKISSAEEYMLNLQIYKRKLYEEELTNLSRKSWMGPNKIGLLCAGINLQASSIFDIVRDIKGESWIEGERWTQDTQGMGTKIAAILLDQAPDVELFVAKSFKSNGDISSPEGIQAAIKAIEHATKTEEWNVDVLVLPFGMPFADKDLKVALDTVCERGKIILTASGPPGRKTFPGRNPQCISIHGVDGRGRNCSISPPPVQGKPNFSTAGACVPIYFENEQLLRSGSVYALGLAAGIVASFLEFVRFELDLDNDEEQRWLCSNDGMREMLLLMSTRIDGYDFLTPWELFSNTSAKEDICRIIKMVIRKRSRVMARHAS